MWECFSKWCESDVAPRGNGPRLVVALDHAVVIRTSDGIKVVTSAADCECNGCRAVRPRGDNFAFVAWELTFVAGRSAPSRAP